MRINDIRSRINVIEDDEKVYVKISFILDIYCYYRDRSLLNSGDNVSQILLFYGTRALFLNCKNEHYLPMRGLDAKILINNTMEIRADRNMLLITDYKHQRRRHGK